MRSKTNRRTALNEDAEAETVAVRKSRRTNVRHDVLKLRSFGDSQDGALLSDGPRGLLGR